MNQRLQSEILKGRMKLCERYTVIEDNTVVYVYIEGVKGKGS